MKSYLKPKPDSFPCLMMGRDQLVVLFIVSGAGTVLHDPSVTPFDIGIYRNDWNMENFERFSGSVTLEN